jgi:GDP-4-dehydro-6-deoxy-D-mannose reductase
MKRALVTGAGGFIGSYMVRFLQRKGWTVCGTYRPDDSNSFPRLPHLRFVWCDLRDRRRVEQVVNECQPTHVFHLGAQSLPTVSGADPVLTFESNMMGSLYLFEAVCRLKRRPVVVSACSSAEYGNIPPEAIPVTEDQPLAPLHSYGISKLCLDLLARQYHADYGVPTVNIRLFNTTGPGKTNDAPSDFVRRIIRIKKGLQPPVLEVGNLKPRRAFLDVQDAVRGFYLAAMRGKRGEVYNLCATKAYEIGEMLEMAIRLSGVKANVKQTSQLMRPSDEKIIFGSTYKMRKHTGWKPQHSIKQTLASMIEHWDRVM